MKKLLFISLCLFNIFAPLVSSSTDLALQATIRNRLRQIRPGILEHYAGKGIQLTLAQVEALEAIDSKMDGIAYLTILASLGMIYGGGKIGYEIGKLYGSYIGKSYDDAAAPGKLEIIKKIEEETKKNEAKTEKEKAQEVLARAAVNLYAFAVCPLLLFFLPFMDQKAEKPDLHAFEKKYSQEYGDMGVIIGSVTGFIGTLILGTYLQGQVVLPNFNE